MLLKSIYFTHILYHITWLDLAYLAWLYKAEIIWLNTFLEFCNFIQVILYMTRLFLFTLNISPKATFRIVDTGFEIDLFTNK